MDSKPAKSIRSKWHRSLGMVFGVAISLASIFWVVNFVGSEGLFSQLSQVRIEHVLLSICFTSLSYVLRAWRWQFFFQDRTLRFWSSFQCLIVGFLMNNVLPARMGEFVRAHMGGRMTGHSRATVLATIAGERLADGVTISAIFAIFFYLGSTAAERAEGQVVLLVALFFGVAALITLFIISRRRWVHAVFDLLHDKFSSPAIRYAIVKAKRFFQGLEPMFQRERIGKLVCFSLLVWFVELASYYQVTQAFGFHMSIGTLSLFLAAVNFSGLVPSAPGALGVIEAFATLALVHVGVGKEIALAMVATQHVIQYLVVGVPGILVYFLLFRGKSPLNVRANELELSRSA